MTTGILRMGKTNPERMNEGRSVTITEIMKPGWQAIGPESYPVALGGGTEWVTFCNEEIPVHSEETTWGQVKSLFR